MAANNRSDVGRERERVAIGRLRGTFERCSQDHWLVEAEAGEMRLIVRRSGKEDVHVCTLHVEASDDERDLICGALDNLSLFLRLFDRAAKTVRELRQSSAEKPQQRARDLARQVAMLLSEQAFQQFLQAKALGATVADKVSADACLKELLSISSKKELNTDARAKADFLSLLGEFEAWKRGYGR